MADKSGAYASKSGDTDFRKTWDKQEYAERARKKDEEERERMQENEKRMKQGAFPIRHRRRTSTHAFMFTLYGQVKHPGKGARRTSRNQQNS